MRSWLKQGSQLSGTTVTFWAYFEDCVNGLAPKNMTEFEQLTSGPVLSFVWQFASHVRSLQWAYESQSVNRISFYYPNHVASIQTPPQKPVFETDVIKIN